MLDRSIYILLLFFCVACTHEKEISAQAPGEKENKSVIQFFYSSKFAGLYEVKSGVLVEDWKYLFAAEVYQVPADGYKSCGLKLYLGNEINFDYPDRDNFINIMGDRYDEIFSFTSDVTEEDYKLHAQLAFKSGNSIAIRGFRGEKVSASSGYNIDYIMRDAGHKITFIKTHSMPCDVLKADNLRYYLYLKPKDVDDIDKFLKFPLPLK